MKKFAIISREDDVSVKISATIQNQLLAAGMEYSEERPDIVCTIGGDGTFLSAIHKYISILNQIVFVGLHTGTLGFFADYTLKQMDEFVSDIVSGTPQIESRSLLKIHLSSINKDCYAVNELLIQRAHTQHIDVYINDRKLETFHGTGLLLSTQIGSTAYNRSIGGAVVEPGLEVMQLSELAGIHHRHYRSLGNPLIISGKNTVTFTSEDFSEATLGFDRYAIQLPRNETIVCSLSDIKVQLAHYHEPDWVGHLEQLY
ncbi:MAG: NAD(+)/NADH kinase [Erysipelotrichaceae bacterium]|nr:NAD(+)/NADH kinase [Erysipelotrichaceae bacterium]